MFKSIALTISVSAIALLSGCVAPDTYVTKVGPVVTNVSMDGNGNLLVEKNTITLNRMTGMFSLEGNPTTQTYEAPRK